MRSLFLFIILLLFFDSFSQSDAIPGIGFDVDRVAETIGGKVDFKRFIENHLIYPESDLESGTNGVVKIKFFCSNEGLISFYKVVQATTPAMEKEAIRLFKLLQFQPALKAGIPIDYESVIEFPFSIKSFRKSQKRLKFSADLLPDFPSDTSLKIYTSYDKSATFFWGNDSLKKFIISELNYPSMAKQQNIEGIVNLTFIVELNGRISNIDLIQSVGGGCNEEAKRVLFLTRWIPAQKDGKFVRSKMSLPISFYLKNNFKDNTIGTQNMGAQ